MNKELQQAYKDFIALLIKDLGGHVVMSHIHGCSTPAEMVEEGKRLRAKIEELEKEQNDV